MTDAKCPKCGSRDFQIADVYTTAYLYEVTGGVVEADGEDKDCGDHVKTICTCRCCDHMWHPRKFYYSIDK